MSEADLLARIVELERRVTALEPAPQPLPGQAPHQWPPLITQERVAGGPLPDYTASMEKGG